MQNAKANTFSSPSQFSVLILVVVITGLTQGLLLPLLTILLAKQGISSGLNGLNAAALYLGIFIMMFFVEKPVRKFGYKNTIIFGLVLIACSTFLFPIWNNIIFWAILRIVVGIGDSALHYSTQLWIVSGSPENKRGRNIALYGMSYGVGFSIGPVGINLLKFNIWLPFLFITLLTITAAILMKKLPHEFPNYGNKIEHSAGTRYKTVFQLAWFALIPSFLYGYMESSTNSNFPVYALHIGLTERWISILLPAIGIGSLILQLPLGSLSDRVGRKKILISAGFIGSLAFLAVPLVGDHVWGIWLLFALAGGLIGSFFTLGLAYAADILPKEIMPSANVIASINFGIGSMIGPNLGGFGMQYISMSSMFYLLGGIFLAFSLLGFVYKSKSAQNQILKQGG